MPVLAASFKRDLIQKYQLNCVDKFSTNSGLESNPDLQKWMDNNLEKAKNLVCGRYVIARLASCGLHIGIIAACILESGPFDFF